MRKDDRLNDLALKVLTHSVRLKPNEKVYLDFIGAQTLPLLEAFVRIIAQKGAIPYPVLQTDGLMCDFMMNASEESIKAYGDSYARLMKEMDVCVRIVGYDNPYALSKVSDERKQWYTRYFMGAVHTNVRVPNTRWCVLRYPTASKASLAGMSTEEYEEFFFNSCLFDYQLLEEAMSPLSSLMIKTDKVKIIAPETDLEFSIKGIGAVKCYGLRNLPDGEVFSAPVKDSINGHITFNTHTESGGKNFKNIRLEFEKGKVIKAYSLINNDALQAILKTDAGACYTGEFALGVNPYITHEVCENLFDEKISGSIHIALGNAQGGAHNGNKSTIHWDMVQIHTPEYGGGEIYFDDILIRKNGIFVLPELFGLNAENLK